MRPADSFSDIAPRPPDIAAWEELLVRFELGPLALRRTLEEVPPESLRDPDLRREIAHLAAHEALATQWIRALRDGAALQPLGSPGGGQPDADPADSRSLLQQYDTLRARNVGAFQRRGLGVWEWTATHPEHGPVTTHQLLWSLIRHDAAHLARVREALSRAAQPREVGSC